ncbi:MAG: hypothetical protein JST05_04690 [Acidobacteria bacterium]|nr:hypothetical protein [Acidobacteriota bacterium]
MPLDPLEQRTDPQEALEEFWGVAFPILARQERERASAILEAWVAAWKGKQRVVNLTRSNHGAFLHFAQFMDGAWVQAFTFIASRKEGVSLRGPDPDRLRRAHKLRRHRVDSGPLDKLYEAWSAHPEARDAGHAVEFFIHETPDETWEACLTETLQCLGS